MKFGPLLLLPAVVLGTSPFLRTPNHQVVCAEAGGACESLCTRQCADLQPAEFARCLRHHKARRCQYKHTENFATTSRHICLEPLLYLHGFEYDANTLQTLDTTVAMRHLAGEDAKPVDSRKAYSVTAQEAEVPMHKHVTMGKRRRLQTKSTDEDDAILQVWAFFKFDNLLGTCSAQEGRVYTTRTVAAVGTYDDFSCLIGGNLWSQERWVETEVLIEDPGTVWVNLSDVPVVSGIGESDYIQVWSDLSMCQTSLERAVSAGIQLTALYDFMPYSQFDPEA
eukprot:Protomagalhaensia_wolfi_Nauph_80__5693@NODE_672_length_2143_cov_298_650665_g499_i0_p1_GENE_NODE_672_length_2143_cov_298_650665_g499_i0NODE_672_length_2143_cov_298_650665_g499_i0_p1_ORF_typecomplete_len281_score29_13UxuA/PF03786_13/0_13_NODE_672_length_2143_cov_298_650665_g499_i012172059